MPARRQSWKLKEVDINGSEGQLVASLDRKEGGEGLGGEHKLTIDGSTRIWRGRELLGLDELVAEGSWPAKGQKQIRGPSHSARTHLASTLPLPTVSRRRSLA